MIIYATNRPVKVNEKYHDQGSKSIPLTFISKSSLSLSMSSMAGMVDEVKAVAAEREKEKSVFVLT